MEVDIGLKSCIISQDRNLYLTADIEIFTSKEKIKVNNQALGPVLLTPEHFNTIRDIVLSYYV